MNLDFMLSPVYNRGKYDRRRLSGLMPLQTIYSEIYFVDVLWPDFTVGEFDKAILWWKEQVRTFGH